MLRVVAISRTVAPASRRSITRDRSNTTRFRPKALPFRLAFRTPVAIARGFFFSSRRPGGDAAFAAVVADVPVVVIDDDGLVVDIGHMSDVVYGPVVEEGSVSPIATFITETCVTESVVDASIEADPRAPIALVENEEAAAPAPPAGSPQKAGFGSDHPSTRNPEIPAIVTIGPIAWSPDVSFTRTRRLLINRQRRRRNSYRKNNGCR